VVELVLAYVGSMFIGFEFMRKYVYFYTFAVMIMCWPIRPLLNTFSIQNVSEWWDIFKCQKLRFSLLILYGLPLTVLLMPLGVVVWAIYGIVVLLNCFHQVINRFNRYLVEGFRPFLVQLAGRRVLLGGKRYANVAEEKVIENIKGTEIPILPVIGVMLITAAFIMQIV